MADEDLLGTMDELEGEGEEEEEEGGGSSLMKYLPLVAGLLVLQIVIAYFVANWWFVPDDAPKDEAAMEGTMEEVEVEAAPEPQAQAEVQAIYEKLEPIVVNPAGTEGLRFLSVTVHLGVSSPEVIATIDERKLVSKINDRLINILRGKTIGELEPENHDSLKAEIKNKLNEILPSKNPNGAPAVVEVYFTGFVLQ